MPHRPDVRRILLLNWRDARHPEGGGSEKYLEEVARGLVGRGHRVTVRTARYPGALGDEVVDGVRYVRRGGRYTVYARALLALAMGRHRSDVVVDVQNGVPFLSPLVVPTPVVNLVHHVHREQWPEVFGPLVARFGWWLESRVAPAVYRACPYVTVSEASRTELVGLGVGRDRISLVHNGTDTVADPHVAKAAVPTIVVLGRIVPQKRIELALEAMAALLPDVPDLRLQVVGSGYWESTVREEVRRLGLQSRVTITGHVSEAEKHRILAEAWVLAVPSLKEGWGLVVVEAGVHATPSVAFRDAGGLRESVRDGETGLLVDGGIAELTAALRSVLLDDDLRLRLGANAVTWARHFRWVETVRRFEEVLDAAVRGVRSPLPAPGSQDAEPTAYQPVGALVGSMGAVLDLRDREPAGMARATLQSWIRRI